LKENYSKLGRKQCAINLGMNVDQVYYMSKKLSLRCINGFGQDSLDINDYNSPIGAYILGFLWSDGHVRKKFNKISLTIVEDDAEEIRSMFEGRDHWAVYNINRSGIKDRNCKNAIEFSISSENLSKLLKEFDYVNKSVKSEEKVIGFINEEYHHYFLRGVSDGDGCFYYNEKNKSRQFSISNSYDYDWSYIESLFESLGIRYKVVQFIRKNKNSKYSQIRITNKEGVLKVGEYIYGGDTFGLSRKRSKFELIKKSCEHKNKKNN
jgi:hypothetical protein